MNEQTSTAQGGRQEIADYSYLENTQEGHQKFYEIVVTVKRGNRTWNNATIVVKGRWGKIGKRAMEQIKYVGHDEQVAKITAAEMLQTRIQHGYEVVERVSA